MPAHKFLNPSTMHATRGYTHVVETRGLSRTIYLAGQLGMTPDGEFAGDPGDFRAQATQAFENPYLQLDIPNRYPLDLKRDLARRLGETFAHIMQATPDLVTVAFRELGEGGVWWCGEGGPEPAALLSCDIRRGRPREQRAELAEALIDACVETLGLRSDRLVVEFTQHTGESWRSP